ncbi:hypothetical protein ACHAQA_008600 [Verticillium albo-atrum]
MAVDVEELIITPFKEVVERGRDAAANAQTVEEDDPEVSKQMTKAAQAVVKEGERALKRLQPLWDAHVDKYGEAFREAIRDSDEIAEKRRVLEDLLYDFEDYIESDSFDLDKFTELQAATKSFALDALNIVKRLKCRTTEFEWEPPAATCVWPSTRRDHQFTSLIHTSSGYTGDATPKGRLVDRSWLNEAST